MVEFKELFFVKVKWEYQYPYFLKDWDEESAEFVQRKIGRRDCLRVISMKNRFRFISKVERESVTSLVYYILHKKKFPRDLYKCH